MESSYVLCWAAKWYGDEKILFSGVNTVKPKSMLIKIYDLLNEADAVIHYNGTKFDIPTLNKEFLLYGMTPPAPYKQIDLLRVAKNQFRFPSNKLDYVAQALGLGKKTKHIGHELWIQCMAGNKEAWAMMEEYNRNDVVLLEKVYDKLKPWIKNHANHGVYEDGICCTNCASINYERRGWAYTTAHKYRRYVCKDCGTWFKASAVNLLGEPKRFSSIA
jgi:uncharacterized protein YprB with RNaseH-like and TPR domain